MENYKWNNLLVEFYTLYNLVLLTGYLKWICFNRDQNSTFNNERKICWSLYWKIKLKIMKVYLLNQVIELGY